MAITFESILPYAIGAAALMVGYHFLTHKQEDPMLSAATNTPSFPDFPRVGADIIHEGPVDSQDAWPHPYAHPKIPRYIGAPAYFQNSIPMDASHYNDDIWYDKQTPPLHITVSQNLPTPETYSHHHFYFETPEPEPTPLDNGILKNIV